jgi:hypothetical protein
VARAKARTRRGLTHRHRQAGRGQGRRGADLHPAGGLKHDERRRERGQAPDQRGDASLVVVDREASPEGRRWTSRLCLATSMPTNAGAGAMALSMTRFRWMRAVEPW